MGMHRRPNAAGVSPRAARVRPLAPSTPAAIAVTIGGIALVAAALAANQAWLDRHFMPSFLLPRPWYVRIETAVRVVIAAAGLLIAAAATRRRGQAGARGGWTKRSIQRVPRSCSSANR